MTEKLFKGEWEHHLLLVLPLRLTPSNNMLDNDFEAVGIAPPLMIHVAPGAIDPHTDASTKGES
jgi:hypothetical protein